jgi:hypothetical protein
MAFNLLYRSCVLHVSITLNWPPLTQCGPLMLWTGLVEFKMMRSGKRWARDRVFLALFCSLLSFWLSVDEKVEVSSVSSCSVG